jgi:antitoxin (DNA-binding transcriptional repressor) of toxin-antitoxin stability system
MPVTPTIGTSDAKTNFSRLTADANRTGHSITVFKNNRPWVEIRPLAYEGDVPEATREAMDKADAIVADPDHVTYKSAESLFSALGL